MRRRDSRPQSLDEFSRWEWKLTKLSSPVTKANWKVPQIHPTTLLFHNQMQQECKVLAREKNVSVCLFCRLGDFLKSLWHSNKKQEGRGQQEDLHHRICFILQKYIPNDTYYTRVYCEVWIRKPNAHHLRVGRWGISAAPEAKLMMSSDEIWGLLVFFAIITQRLEEEKGKVGFAAARLNQSFIMQCPAFALFFSLIESDFDSHLFCP